MKKTLKFFLILAVLLFAVSCQESGLDNGQAVKGGKLNLTATIVTPDASRVTYDVDNETTHTITPSWTVGDKIIGFDDEGVTFTFEVASLNGDHAVLDDGGYVPGSATKLYAIYAPGKLASDISANTLSVDLGTQSGELDEDSPVLMCATAAITGSDVTLDFENQTAIIGVTKFKLPAAGTLTSISVDGLVTAGTFEVSGDVLVLTPAATTATATATGSWATGAENVCETAIYFATLPTASAKIALRASDGVNDYGNLASIAATDVVAGNYYYMNKTLGAPVADVNGVKYGTIDDAWAAANRANSAVTVTLLDNCSAAARLALDATGTGAVTFDLNGHNLVTANQIRVTGRNLTLTDNSSAVLAEQGVISTTYTEGRLVYVNGGSFTMLGGTVNRSCNGNYQAVFAQNSSSITISSGKVISNHSSVYCETESSITIDGNTIIQADSTGVNNNGGTLLIEGSPVITASLGGAGYGVRSQGTGTTTIRGTASITGDNAVYAQTGTTVTISGNPTAHSDAGATLYAAAGTINISGGTFSRGGTGNGYVAYTGNADGRINISGGTFTNTPTSSVVRAYTTGSVITVTGGCFISNGVNPIDVYNGTVYVSGGVFNKPIQPTYAKDASSNEYVNVLNTDPATAETYPFTVSPASSTPKVATVTQGSYTWENGSFESALKNADVRAAANGNSTVTMDTDCDASSTSYVSSANTYNVVLDLNGHTVSSTASPAISSAGKFILQDSGSGGELATSGAVALEITSGTATINSGSLYGETNAASVSSGASLVINGGHIWGNGAADITGIGTATVYGGYYRYDPTSLCAASAAASGVTESFGGRTYNYQVVAVVATVNGVGYSTLAATADAAVAYDGSDPKVTLQLQDNVTHNAALNLTHASKPVVLDLNGHILSTNCVNFIKPESGTLTITDSQDKVGKMTTSSYQIIYAGSSSVITISNCVIEGTMEEASASGSEMLMLSGGTSNMTISGARIYTRGKQTVLRLNNANCNVTIGDDSELSSGIESEDSFFAIAHNDGYLTINGGSFYSKNNSVIQHTNTDNQNMTTTIYGGYFYSGSTATYCLRANRGRTDNGLVLNGGYMSKAPSGAKVYYGTGKSLQNCSETHTHETTGELLTYTKVVAVTP